MTNEAEQTVELTVGQLISDLQTLPADAGVFVGVMGAGITIPIVGLSKFTTMDNKVIIVFGVPAQNTVEALEVYQTNMLKHSEAGEPN